MDMTVLTQIDDDLVRDGRWLGHGYQEGRRFAGKRLTGKRSISGITLGEKVHDTVDF